MWQIDWVDFYTLRKMSQFAGNGMITPDTPKYHKISKQVLQQYQEQVRAKKIENF